MPSTLTCLHPLRRCSPPPIPSIHLPFSTASSHHHPAPHPPPQLRRTPFHGLHCSPPFAGKMVNFTGYHLPLHYASTGGHISEHFAVRNKCGLFDVSHMLQTIITGKLSTALVSLLLPTSLKSLQPLHSALSVMLNEKGGILDDCILTKWSDDQFYLVSNSATRDRVKAWIASVVERHFGADKRDREDGVRIEHLEEQGLLALQGPLASKVLQELVSSKSNLNLNRDLYFGQTIRNLDLGGFGVHLARTGYTGEDGFEISIDPQSAREFGHLLSTHPDVSLAGLAARDSLRLEAGMCLSGIDFDEATTVHEAGLSWLVGKDRIEQGGFIGHSATRAQALDKSLIRRRRVGCIIEPGPPGRASAQILTPPSNKDHAQSDTSEHEPLGSITSGLPSPSLSQNIAMGYVPTGFHLPGTPLHVLVRGKRRAATVVKMPFLKPKFHKPNTLASS